MESQNMEVRKMVSKTNRFLLERIMLLQPWRVRGAKTIAVALLCLEKPREKYNIQALNSPSTQPDEGTKPITR